MLEDDYRRRLNELLAACECDVAVPSQWREVFARCGVITPVPGDRRRFVRYYFTTRAIAESRQTLPAVPRREEYHHVLTRDLSRTGIAFLHCEQFFPGEQVVLWLPDGKREYVVVRCQRHNARCYEIGAALIGDRDQG